MNQKRIKKQHLAYVIIGVSILAAGSIGLSSSFATDSNIDQLQATKITPGQAATIGINYIGAQPSQLVTVDFDQEDGIYLYGVEIHKDGKEFDVKVDPQTGDVKKVEVDPIDTSEDETNDATETNDGKSISDGDGETDDNYPEQK